MSRPADWSALGLAGDPTPGDPVVVRDGGRDYSGVADTIARAASTLRRLDAGSSTADSVKALLESRDKVVDDVGRAEGRYRAAGSALSAYATVLDRVQADTLHALSQARSAQAEVEAAEAAQHRYHRWAEDADQPEDSDQREEYERREARQRSEASAARARIAAQLQVVEQAVADRDTAAAEAIGQITATTSGDGLKDSWWDDWGAKVTEWIAQIAEAVATIAGILALLVCWIPVIGQALAGVLLVVAAVAGIVAALANIALAATGEKSWGEAVVSIVFAVLGCVGLGAARGALGGLKAGFGALRAGGLAELGGLRGLVAGTARNFLTSMRGLVHGALSALTGGAGGGRSVFGAAGDAYTQYAARAQPLPGFHDVVLHGSPVDFGATPESWEQGLNFGHRQLAAMLAHDPGYTSEPVRLLACSTGAIPGGAAQNLANKLGVSVLAPSDVIWAYPSGRLTIGQFAGIDTGEFRLFVPGGSGPIVPGG